MFKRREKSWLDKELERERKQSQGAVTLRSRIMDILRCIPKKPVLQAAVYGRACAECVDMTTERRRDIETQLALSRYGVRKKKHIPL